MAFPAQVVRYVSLGLTTPVMVHVNEPAVAAEAADSPVSASSCSVAQRSR
jgi:hypothetical protein